MIAFFLLSDKPGRNSDVTKSLKSEILLSMKTEISAAIKSEMKSAPAHDFDFLKKRVACIKSRC